MRITVGRLRELASEVLETCDLSDIRIQGASCSSSDVIAEGPYAIDAQIQVKGVDLHEVAKVNAIAKYTVVATPESGGGEAWRVEADIVAAYQKSADVHFDEDHLSAFAVAIALMSIHPYAREVVQSLVSRMGYPPFTMDLLPPVTGRPDEEELDLAVSD